MAHREKVVKKREMRIKQRAREREEIFICDYVKQKYPDIHAEAAQTYQLLIKKYPDKADLRKTSEHKTWKNMNATILHPAFNMIQTDIIIPPLAQMKLCFPEQPQNTEPPATAEPQNTEPSPTPTPEPQTSPEPPTPSKSSYSDNMRLVIPLIKPPAKQPEIIVETLEIVTEQTLQGDQEQQTMEQIDPQTMDQVIEELRADPNLKDIFADIEMQFDQELDIDIDIGMDTRLEDELNWEFW